nr:tRNA dihydrouridine synthase DusB [Oceanococcus sp. HetDA_MAG_MS8]
MHPLHGTSLPLILAPMAGVTDAPMRQLCRRYGADLCYGEMTAANQDDAQRAKFQRRLHQADETRPWIVQLAGAEPEVLAEGAQVHAAMGADVIDINMGCPAKKVRKKACGSALLGDPGLVKEIFQAVTQAVELPVSVKIRTGLHSEHVNAVDIAELAEDCGLSAIAVHGRSRAQMYKGQAEYRTIREVKKAVGIPVIANGDIDSASKALQVLEATDADALMIGRAALGQPWLFAQIAAAIAGGQIPEPPSMGEFLPDLISHAYAVDALYGQRMGLKVFRKHLAAWMDAYAVPKLDRLPILRAEDRAQSLDALTVLCQSLTDTAVAA